MIPLSETITMLISFLFAYFLLFVWVPSLVIRFEPEHNGPLDKLFISLTHSTLFLIIAVHLLVAVRLFETLSLIALIIASMVLLSRYYSRSESVNRSIKVLTALFDLTEDREQWKIELKKLHGYIRERGLSKIHTVKYGLTKHPIMVSAYLLVFSVALVDRFKYSFTHLSFASSDSYVHLGWSKYLVNMTMYLDGVYPYGFEATIGALFQIFHIDMYVITRFMGGLTVLLSSLSLVYALRKMIGKDYITILLCVFLFFYSASVMVHNEVILWRQLSALSMEFATIFLLPGITFLYLFFKSGSRLYLLLAAECYAITVFTHPFVAVIMTMAYISVGLAHNKKLWSNKTLLRIIGYMGAAGVMGILPPVIGLLSGKSFHGSSINYFKGELEAEEEFHIVDTILTYVRDEPLTSLMVLFVVCYFGIWLISRLINKSESPPIQSTLLFAGLFEVFMVIFLLAPNLGLPSIVAVDRQPVFLTMATALLCGVVTGYLVKLIKRGRLRLTLQVIGSILIVLLVLNIPGQKMVFPPGDQHQYDEAIRAYLDIKENYPLLNWDIISPVDELVLTRGYGYHTELWEFVRNLDNPEKRTLKFLTPYVFLFIEKVPVDIMGNDFRPIKPEDATMPFPVATDGMLTEFYYGSNLQNRRILQAKAYYWAEEYMKTNQDMKVYMETPNYKIYEIYQDGKMVSLNKKQVSST